MTSELPDEWERVAEHVRWPQPDLRRHYPGDGSVVLEDPEGRPIMRSDTIADDVVGDLEKGAPE
ncbi:hypothetical protein EI982_09505 [Haloplanus rallus]|uniref:Uncharacterized protein n=1 Tax=Haloplanus rallus TaxID=1816183 RepID=A0A6B9FE74_9EURY|nr:hypothetical protein [Haloplanus rallus]QGX95010.1 hypothetical protein EI982_09505 [Haloplanus rallus]